MTESQNNARVDAVALKRFVDNKDYDGLESAWIAAAENGSVESEDLISILQVVARRGEAARLETLFWCLLTAVAERDGADEGLNVARQIASILPDCESIRQELASLYQKACGTYAEVQTLTEMTVLRQDIPLATALQHIEKFLTFCPGVYVLDRRLRDAGRVVGLAVERKVLEVLFEDRTRIYDSRLINSLDAIEDDDFRALVAFERPKMESLAQEEPAELVWLVLKTHGPRLEFADLKPHLTKVVPDSSWSKWWSAARPLVKRSAKVEMSDGARPFFILRDRLISYEETVRRQFEAAETIEERFLLVLDHLDEAGDDPEAEIRIVEYFAEQLAAQAADLSDPASALGALAVLAEIRKRVPQVAQAPVPPIEQILPAAAEVSTLLGSLRNDAIMRCVLDFLREALPGKWQEIFAAVMPSCSMGICDWIARELSKGGRAGDLKAVVAEILKRPEQYVGALVWLWRAACAGRFPEVLAEVDRVALAVRLLSVADGLGRDAYPDKARQRELLSLVRGGLSARNYALLGDVLAQVDVNRARSVRNVVERNAGLSEQARVRVLDMIKKTCPELFTKAVHPWEEDATYTTEEGLKRLQREFADLTQIEIPKNSKAIGEAAARGDLSENAEFTAALEERDRLTGKASDMEAELAKIRVIPESMAESTSVTIGSAVQVKDLTTGKSATFVFLGPWDADPNNKIYSYRAPLSLAFMGKSAGDIAVLSTDKGEQKWEILGIRAGI